MATLHLLGTGAPASDPHRTTTMLAFETDDRAVLIDCGADVIHRALRAGLRVDQIAALILTHEHPDHVGGFSLFVEKMWLFGRSESIPVYGPQAALDQARGNFESYNTERWEAIPDLEWHPISLDEGAAFLEVDELAFSSSPTDHGVPCVAVRVDNRRTGASICYSSDTRPCESVIRLSTGCDILVHEAGGDNPVHTTIDQAAEVAHRAGCPRLILVHLPEGHTEADLVNARKLVGDVSLGEEMGSVGF